MYIGPIRTDGETDGRDSLGTGLGLSCRPGRPAPRAGISFNGSLSVFF